MNVISVLLKETLESSLTLSACRGTVRGLLMNQEAVLTRHGICWYLALSLSSIQNYEKCLLFKSYSVYGILLWQPKQR